MSKAVRAWLLNWPPQPLALAMCEVVEVLQEPEVHRTPVGPDWCRALVFWRDRLVPLALSADRTLDGLTVVIVTYQTEPRTALEYAAIAVRGMPKQIDVPPDADCEPPSDCLFQQQQLRACFLHEDRALVVPELRNLFAPAA